MATRGGGQERGQGKKYQRKSHKKEDVLGVHTWAAMQSRTAPHSTERKKETSTCAQTGYHSHHAQCTNDGGLAAWSWTRTGCVECLRSIGV